MNLNLDKSAWKLVSLGDVAAASKEKVDPLDGSVGRYIAGEHMSTNDLQLRRWGSTEEADLGPAFHRRFRPGQVLYGSRRTYLRKVAVADFGGVCSNTTFVVGTRNDDVLLQRFLPFVMSSEPFHSFAIAESKGSVNPYVNWSDIERFEFNLPPLDQQKRIADLLWAIEHYRRSIEPVALYELEGDLLESVLRIDAPKVPISSMGSVLMGRQRSPKHAAGDHMIPYLRVANVGDNELRLEDVKQMNFTPDEQKRYCLESQDILISEGQSRELVGQSALITELTEPTCFQNTLIRFRADPTMVSPAYAQTLFRACLRTGVFSSIATQTTSIAHLGVQRFAKLELPLPDIDEQCKILKRIGIVVHALDANSAEIATLNQIRTSLMHNFFGG